MFSEHEHEHQVDKSLISLVKSDRAGLHIRDFHGRWVLGDGDLGPHEVIVCCGLALYQATAGYISPALMVVVVYASNATGKGISGSQSKTTLSYTPDTSRSYIESSAKSYASTKENVNRRAISEPVQQQVVTEQERAAKIHDFCFGMPFETFKMTSQMQCLGWHNNLKRAVS